MSRKSVRFTVRGGPAAGEGPGGAPRGPETIDARSDEWVSDRNTGAAAAGPRELVLDLAAERSLTEIWAISLLTPMALGWFWLVHAMNGRVRI